MFPKRGEVWWVNFDPTKGSEIRKKRPAIVVSNNKANKHLSRIQVVPLTSNVESVYPSECLVMVKKQECKAMTDQLRTISKKRLGKKVSKLSSSELKVLEEVLKIQLGLL